VYLIKKSQTTIISFFDRHISGIHHSIQLVTAVYSDLQSTWKVKELTAEVYIQQKSGQQRKMTSRGGGV